MYFQSASVLARIQLHNPSSIDLSPEEGGRLLVIAEEGAARTALHEPVPVQRNWQVFSLPCDCPKAIRLIYDDWTSTKL